MVLFCQFARFIDFPTCPLFPSQSSSALNQILLIVVEMDPLNSNPVDKQVVNGSYGLKGILHEVSNVDKKFSGKLHQ